MLLVLFLEADPSDPLCPQVVAGMNYDLTVEVSSENPCRVDHYQVWDRFGTLTLTKSDTLLDRCTGGDHLLRGSTSETK